MPIVPEGMILRKQYVPSLFDLVLKRLVAAKKPIVLRIVPFSIGEKGKAIIRCRSW